MGSFVGGAATRVTRRRKVRQQAGGAFHQAHGEYGPVGLEDEPPFPGAVPESTHARVLRCLEFGGGKRQRGSNGDRCSNLAPRRTASVIDAHDRDRRRLVAGVHEPQAAHLVYVAAGIEDRDAVSVVRVRRDIVHRRQEPRYAVVGAVVARLDARVGENLDVEVAGQLQSPIALAAARGTGQSLVCIACLEVVRVDVYRLPDAEGKSGTSAALAGTPPAVVQAIRTPVAQRRRSLAPKNNENVMPR
ncbi:MAG: hypothetical protein OXH09_04205 [Gammaproteobacteria bacterium]|nr:hypothetical protein [Gammaproteobacteria bacterium]